MSTKTGTAIKNHRFCLPGTLIIRYVYSFHLFRIWKLLIGHPLDTSEQQLGHFLSRYDQFIAIGKPGERIVTTGAARRYVGKDEWQDKVVDLMDRSAFVLVQPSKTEGIWWELGQVLRGLPGNRLLMCLVNYSVVVG